MQLHGLLPLNVWLAMGIKIEISALQRRQASNITVDEAVPKEL